jgi:cupin superfamily acireductone dioxygenase involved in methionine salvage
MNSGWSKDDYKTLHDLKVKANLFNLEVGHKILRDEISVRAKQTILETYEEKINYLMNKRDFVNPELTQLQEEIEAENPNNPFREEETK